MKFNDSFRAVLPAFVRHVPGLLLLAAAIALFGGALSVALAREQEALHDIAQGRSSTTGSRTLKSRNKDAQPYQHPPSVVVQPTLAPLTSVDIPNIPNAQIKYYVITGTTATALRKQMNTLGPLDAHGVRSDAVTDWFVRWTWPGYGSAQCDLTQVQVSASITVTFPQWSIPISSEAQPGLMKLTNQWQRYTLRLAQHESGHVELALKNQNAIRQSIERATCTTADHAAQQALARLNTLQASYDTKTRHGATQGATFP